MSLHPARRSLDHHLTIRPMVAEDLTQLHQLSIGVAWPHRPEDWQLIMGLGEGFMACDAIGRALGSAMWWPFGRNFASVGMVITSPRVQAHGAGRRLMDAVLERTGTRDLRLSSTRAGYRLYIALGFQPIGRIFQHQGRARVSEGIGDSGHAGDLTIREVEAGDLDALAALDASAYGADRKPVIAALLPVSTGTVALRDGKPVGFALCRQFGRGHVVGPIVAEDDAMAIALTRPHVVAHQGGFLRVDTAFEQTGLGQFLEASGMPIFDTVTPMIRGKAHGGKGAPKTYGLVTQALG